MTVTSDVRSQVEDFLHDVCGVDRGVVRDELRLDDVDVDSLEMVALVQRLQKRYGVPLQDERLLGLRTVGELVELVSTGVEQAQSPAAAGER